MAEVNITTLRQHLPEYLARVERGERIRVTSRGRVIAEIAPPLPEAAAADAALQLDPLRQRRLARARAVPRVARAALGGEPVGQRDALQHRALHWRAAIFMQQQQRDPATGHYRAQDEPPPHRRADKDPRKYCIGHQQQLRATFDYVIFDAPPISMVTDAAVIGNQVDGALFVVRSSYAPAESVEAAVKKLKDTGVKVLGAVLTRYDAKTALKGSNYAYNYYSYSTICYNY